MAGGSEQLILLGNGFILSVAENTTLVCAALNMSSVCICIVTSMQLRLSIWSSRSGKVFDTVDYDVHLKMLPSFGITNESFMWFKSYLNNRKQVVSINGVHSEEGVINFREPQGGVLGPLLLVLCINNICNLCYR
ncbi:Reverse transcriptase domain [Cinara cedri]|uniref:Reverse transcriptase domain n=1 Tax=Cinara cedri TaxID=506608 RepID=A0A5E4M6W8_9HEMI|nr:Reverse transcriptase domain [Cinara cedri]